MTAKKEWWTTLAATVLMLAAVGCSGASDGMSPNSPTDSQTLAAPDHTGDPPPPPGEPTRIDLIISSPTGGERPCSTFVAIVEHGEPLELGVYCGALVEDRDATVGVLNLQGLTETNPTASDRLWAFRAIREGDTLSFLRVDLEHEGSDWYEVAAFRVRPNGPLVTEITWPGHSGPTIPHQPQSDAP